MEMKPGYKQTNIGVMPRDWSVEAISSVADVKTGPFGSALHERDYVDDGTPIITVEHLSEHGIIHHNLPLISDADRSRLKSYRLRADDIVFSRVGSVDRNSLIREEEDGWLFSGRLLRIRISDNTTYPPYLSYHFHSEPFKRRVRAVAVGQTMASLNTQILKAICVVLPTTPEQRAIAEALSDVDILIESLEQLLTKKRQINKGALQELLTGKKRLHGFSEEWEMKSLGEMGKCYRGVSYNPNVDLSPFDTEITARLLRSNNVQEANVVFLDMQYVDIGRVSSEQRLRPRDILICMANGSRDLVGKAGQFLANDGFEYTFGAFMGCFRPNDQNADLDFVFYLFQTEKYRRHIGTLLAGSSINNLTPGSVEGFFISVPSDKVEQTAIATILSDMDAEIVALEAKLSKTRQLKQGMMQELLTGRIRLI